MNNFYITSFKTFFKIGMFTLGGGYAMIPIIEAEVVDKYRWIDREQFIDIVAVAQSCPGVMAVDMSTFIGYKMRGTRGALCTTLATALPSFFIILAIASIVIYFALPAETRAPYFFACCFTAVLIKGVEVCIRMFSRKSEES